MDLRNNNISCGDCENRWLSTVYSADSVHQWGIGSVFRDDIPNHVFTDREFTKSCLRLSSTNCIKSESVAFAPLKNATLGQRFELECIMNVAAQSTPRPRRNPFYWPLSSNGETKGKVEWSSVTTAKLLINDMTSAHLGIVACRCFQCAEPTFSTVEVKWPIYTPISDRYATSNFSFASMSRRRSGWKMSPRMTPLI